MLEEEGQENSVISAISLQIKRKPILINQGLHSTANVDWAKGNIV
jgi:hypothetical protein